MSREFELEDRVHRYLAEERQKEKNKRVDLIWQIRQSVGTEALPGEFPQDFIDQLEQTPLDWQIDFSKEGIRFKRDFPYETVFYGMRGWDAARIVINLDIKEQAVAFRAHLYDEQADMRINEGLLVENGEITSFEREMEGGGVYRSVLREIHEETEATKGKSGCLFDHARLAIDNLPELVRNLCRDNYGDFLETFVRLANEGKIDTETMPRLSLGWPLLSPYHRATE